MADGPSASVADDGPSPAPEPDGPSAIAGADGPQAQKQDGNRPDGADLIILRCGQLAHLWAARRRNHRPLERQRLWSVHRAAGPFAKIAIGANFGCGLRSDGQVRCWGANSSGQATPPAHLVVTQVSAGNLHACGVQLDGSAKCGLRPNGYVACWGSYVIPDP